MPQRCAPLPPDILSEQGRNWTREIWEDFVRWIAAERGLQGGVGFGQEEGKGDVPSDPAEAGSRAGWCEVCVG